MANVYYESKEKDFSYKRKCDKQPDMKDFFLHNHSNVAEILMFLRGDSEFRIEGSIYQMQPYDIAIVNSREMHRMWHHSTSHPYERVVISIEDRFFLKNNCEEFKRMFFARPLGVNNVYRADVVKQNGIDIILNDMEGYIHDEEELKGIAIKCKLIDFLYNLNKISVKHDIGMESPGNIKEVLMYINDNITSNITLDHIAECFYMSKYYLCHIFKKHTGLTISQYINHKRLLIAVELCGSGKSLTEASMEAGFGNYSSFYRAYVREFSKSPRECAKS